MLRGPQPALRSYSLCCRFISHSFPARPVFVRSYSRDKLDTLVDFPLTGLDMGPYLLPQVRCHSLTHTCLAWFRVGCACKPALGLQTRVRLLVDTASPGSTSSLLLTCIPTPRPSVPRPKQSGNGGSGGSSGVPIYDCFAVSNHYGGGWGRGAFVGSMCEPCVKGSLARCCCLRACAQPRPPRAPNPRTPAALSPLLQVWAEGTTQPTAVYRAPRRRLERRETWATGAP